MSLRRVAGAPVVRAHAQLHNFNTLDIWCCGSYEVTKLDSQLAYRFVATPVPLVQTAAEPDDVKASAASGNAASADSSAAAQPQADKPASSTADGASGVDARCTATPSRSAKRKAKAKKNRAKGSSEGGESRAAEATEATAAKGTNQNVQPDAAPAAAAAATVTGEVGSIDDSAAAQGFNVKESDGVEQHFMGMKLS